MAPPRSIIIDHPQHHLQRRQPLGGEQLEQVGIRPERRQSFSKHALETFAGAVPSISPVAFDLQGYVYNRVMFNAIISRLGQAIVGEMTLEEAYERMEQDITQQIEEKKRGG